MMKNVKKSFILLNTLIVVFLVNPSQCKAEKIYCKDGKITCGKITHRDKNSVWIKYRDGSIGVSIEDIDRIENDDGSISKYGYESICNTIQGYIREKDYSKAIGLCDALLESFPDKFQVYYLRALLNQKAGNFTKAVEDYSFLIEHKIADAEILNNLGAIYAYDKKHEKAMDLFIKASGESPYMAEAYYNLAQLLMQINEYLL